MTLTPFDQGIADHSQDIGLNQCPFIGLNADFWRAGWARAEGLRRARSFTPSTASAMVIPPGPIEQKKLVIHAAELSEIARDLCFAAVLSDKVASPVKLGNALVGLEKIIKSLQEIYSPPLMAEVDLSVPPAIETEGVAKEELPE